MTGDLVPGFEPAPDNKVTEVVVSPDGATVYAGGAFSTLGGQPRYRAGAVHASTGRATDFAPTGSGGNAVTIGLSPDGERLFVGTQNNTLFAYDATVSNNPVWSIKTSGDTQAIAVSDDEMRIGGHFSQIVTGKIPRPFIASLDPVDGSVNDWNPKCAGPKMGVGRWCTTAHTSTPADSSPASTPSSSVPMLASPRSPDPSRSCTAERVGMGHSSVNSCRR